MANHQVLVEKHFADQLRREREREDAAKMIQKAYRSYVNMQGMGNILALIKAAKRDRYGEREAAQKSFESWARQMEELQWREEYEIQYSRQWRPPINTTKPLDLEALRRQIDDEAPSRVQMFLDSCSRAPKMLMPS